jgi:hypothetical protein
MSIYDGEELFMCQTDFDCELGMAAGGTALYASVSDLKRSRQCIDECGIVAVRVQLVRVVELGKSYSERGEVELTAMFEADAARAGELSPGSCPDCEGEGELGGQFCGGHWKCEACDGTGKAPNDKS